MYDLERMPQIAQSMDSFTKDCAITVALKIADDSCKMDEYEKRIFMLLYDMIEEKSSSFFDASVFDVIKAARERPDAKIYATIKPLRESAMDMITRPKMKAFKAEIRKQLLS